ncbi:MAG: hypothetical protein GF350_12050 [Chitinivibrionales bacterium]|nr:hypothetical protein [Chitinivibrionales bacterium]
MNKKMYGIVSIAAMLFAGCVLENRLPDNLPVSPFDSKPGISLDAIVPDSIEPVISTNTLQLMLEASQNEEFMEYHYSLSLSGQSAAEVYVPITNPEFFAIGPLNETLPGQTWTLKIFGNYRENTLVSDTLVKVFSVDASFDILQLSPSIMTVSRSIHTQFFVDIILDEIPDTLTSWEASLKYNTDTLKVDSVSIMEYDSLYYFAPAQGSVARIENHNTISGILTLTCGIHSGIVEGIAGSGRIARVYCTALRTGKTGISVLNATRADIHNRILACPAENATIEILP